MKNVLAGHARLEAAKLLGLAEVPTIRIASMSEEEKRAYVIADNRLAELAGWDFDLLGKEIGFLLDTDLEFDIGVIGFDTAEIDGLVFGNTAVAKEMEEEPVELPGDEPVVSQRGDLWLIGEHRLLCGDALDPECQARLMSGKKAQMIFTELR